MENQWIRSKETEYTLRWNQARQGDVNCNSSIKQILSVAGPFIISRPIIGQLIFVPNIHSFPQAQK